MKKAEHSLFHVASDMIQGLCVVSAKQLGVKKKKTGNKDNDKHNFEMIRVREKGIKLDPRGSQRYILQTFCAKTFSNKNLKDIMFKA